MDERLENRSTFVIENLYYQNLHEKPMAGGYITRMKDEDFESYRKIPLLNYVINLRNRDLLQGDTARNTLERYENLPLKKLLEGNPYKFISFSKKASGKTLEKLKIY